MDYNQLLRNKRAFVTTGARGIGKEIALLFARQGAVLAVGGREGGQLKAAMSEIQKLSPESAGFVCDLSLRKEVENTCDRVLETFGGIDILINVVGVNKHCPAHEYDEETLERLLATNYKSGLRCAKKLIPGMLERGAGNIINISSIHGVMTMPGYTMYAGTKGAMNASARAMALDYAGRGIRVNTICPGLIMSDNMLDEIHSYPEGEEREEYMRMLTAMQPLPPGRMEDVAHAALYLASEMSSYVTGQMIMLDGGASIKAH